MAVAKSSTLSIERLRAVLDYDSDTGLFRWRVRSSDRVHIGDVAGSFTSHNYVRIRIDGQSYLAHRLAWFYVNGIWPTDQIDHVNRDKHDNRIANLRGANHSQNAGNSVAHRRNTSGIKGVTWHRRSKRWQAQIAGQYLGFFQSLDDAKAAYDAAARERFGEFARFE